MKITRASFTMMFGLLVATGMAQFSWGQILDAAAESTTTATTEVQQAGGVDSDLGVVEQTSWPSIPLPKISMPQITLPRLWPSTEDDRPALLAPFVAGFAKVSDGTKKAWEGTKDIFSVGSKQESSATSAKSTPSFWKRLIGRSPQKQYDDGPQTVGEFMSQKRLDP